MFGEEFCRFNFFCSLLWIKHYTNFLNITKFVSQHLLATHGHFHLHQFLTANYFFTRHVLSYLEVATATWQHCRPLPPSLSAPITTTISEALCFQYLWALSCAVANFTTQQLSFCAKSWPIYTSTHTVNDASMKQSETKRSLSIWISLIFSALVLVFEHFFQPLFLRS